MNPDFQIIALLPADMSGLPDVGAAIPKPSIEHTLMKCPRCGRDAWIGPAQLFKHRTSGTETACYYCLISDLASGAIGYAGSFALDRTADEKPRRT